MLRDFITSRLVKAVSAGAIAASAMLITTPSVAMPGPCEGFARKYCLYQGYTLGTPEFEDCVANYILTFCETAREAPPTQAQMLAILRG
ncbi:MAG: hypothetical protein EON90_14035 [Brevundimonas sp.]|nr:MAG: hypothetical protein EON90_14035 [Brevundimonas sp.]